MKHDWYAASAEGLLAALWLANPLTVALMKPGFVKNTDTQKVWADIAASEVAASGAYTAGGKLLTGKAAPYNAATDTTDLQAADSTWGPAATIDSVAAVVYDNSGAKPLWSVVDFEGTKSVSSGILTIDWDNAGLLSLVSVPSP